VQTDRALILQKQISVFCIVSTPFWYFYLQLILLLKNASIVPIIRLKYARAEFKVKLKAFFTAEPQSAPRIFILCLPLRSPALQVGMTDPFNILAGRPPANIKVNSL
jgi:hypothetical protein